MRHSPIFGQVVAAFRADLSMSQEAMSARLGWSAGVLSRIESGRTKARIHHIADVERLLMDEKRLDKAGDVFKLVMPIADELARRGIEPEGPELHRLAQRTVDNWLTARSLPGWPPACPVCGVYEGRCLVMHAPGARSEAHPVHPRRFTRRPHSGRQGGRAYYSEAK